MTPDATPRTYSIAELNSLLEQWAIDQHILATDKWRVDCFLAWIQKNERESMHPRNHAMPNRDFRAL